jgi:hypothetical protein
VADHPTCEPTTVRSGPALTGQYEQLRQVALAGHAEGWRHGLGVLATRGVTGWMSACQTIPPPPAPPAPARAAAGGLGGDAGELVAVMAAMALAHV